jgi:hypothetical protein
MGERQILPMQTNKTLGIFNQVKKEAGNLAQFANSRHGCAWSHVT